MQEGHGFFSDTQLYNLKSSNCIYMFIHITHELYGNRFSAVKTYDLLWYQWDTYFDA